MSQKKMSFEDFLIAFRRTRKGITNPVEIVKYSNDYNLDIETDNLPIAIYTYGAKGYAWLVEDAKIGFWTILNNEQPSSNLISDVEYELAQWYYSEDSYNSTFFEIGVTDEQRHYLLDALWVNIDHFQKSAKDLEIVLMMDDQYKVDANDYIAHGNPFKVSFDEFQIELSKWADKAKELIAIRTYQPNSDKVNPLHQAHKPQ